MAYGPVTPQAIRDSMRALLQQGSGPDTILARIGPREASLLQSMGGSGRTDTAGIVRFANEGAQGGMGGGGTGGPGGGNAGANGGGGSGGGGMGGGGGYGGGGGGYSAGAPTYGGSGYVGYSGTHPSGPGYGFGPSGSPSGPQPTGARGPLGPGGLPVHTAGTSAAGIAAPTGDYAGVGSAYESAASSYANRSFGDQVLGGLLGMIPGFHYAEQPNPGLPSSWSGGTWHSGFNPGAALGALAGFGMPGLGIAGSFLGGQAYNAAVGPDIGLGGVFGNQSAPGYQGAGLGFNRGVTGLLGGGQFARV